MKKINIGLIGLGNVGSGVLKILNERKALLAEKIGLEINIKKICDIDPSAKKKIKLNKNLFSRKIKDIIDDPAIDIVVELIGGIHPAKEYIIQALEKGKSIVTANKALLAQEGRHLFALARDRGKSIYFEASVGAGIPIIKILREGLIVNKFSGIFGIVNGTSNYVLSQMSEQNRTFKEALAQARKKGFAEKDSTLDIEGIDSAHKLILLTYLASGKFVGMQDIFIEGISHISLADINYAKEMGLEIKLLAIAKKEASELEVRVHPTLIPSNHLLSSVSGIFNAIYVSSDLAGNMLFYGPGAGQLCAASAVVSDLVDLTADIKAGMFRPTLNISIDKSVKKLRKIDDIESRYYIRFMAKDQPGVLARIAGVLAKFGISIASVTQKERKRAQFVPIVMIVHDAKEKNLSEALRIVDKLNIISGKSVAIRIEEI
ncbi:MAG: homoserine dehydrogenase [Candidatus Omnitrophota bacterium]|nr:MAG: homoserine dehydrogenase [Candidatus Omnitrophota bacterium]